MSRNKHQLRLQRIVMSVIGILIVLSMIGGMMLR
jgi:hypothetical protein